MSFMEKWTVNLTSYRVIINLLKLKSWREEKDEKQENNGRAADNGTVGFGGLY